MEVAIQEVFDDVATSFGLVAATRSYLIAIQQAIDLLIERFRAGNKLLVFGDGSTSACAQHVCGALIGRSSKDRRPLPVIAVSEEAVGIALSDDCRFETTVFARQVEALGQPGDVAWGISTSSKSAEVVSFLKAARTCGMRTIGLTAQGGGEADQFCDILMLVPLSSAPGIHEVHLVTCHVICAAVERVLRVGAVTHLAACPCGHVVEISQVTQLSAYCEECFGEFYVEEGIRRYLVRGHMGDRSEYALARS